MSAPEFGPPAKVLHSLEQITPETLESLAQWIEQRGLKTPISQVVGYQQIKAFTSLFSTNAAVTTVSNAWTNTGLGGSSTGVRSGQYLLFISAVMKNSTAFDATMLGIQVNGSNPSAGGAGSHASGTANLIVEGSAVGAGVLVGVSMLSPLTLTADTNTITPVWFVSGGTGTVTNYIITLVRIGTSAGSSF